MQENVEFGKENEGTSPVDAVPTPVIGEAAAATREKVACAPDAAEDERADSASAEQTEAASAPPQKGSDEWYRQDSAAFDSAYPTLDKDALFADEDFLSYAEGKVGEVPLAEVYDGYLRLKKSLADKARTQVARANAAGSLRQAASDGEQEYYTLGEMQAMSPKYIEEHWDKVQKSLKRLR